MFKIGNLVTCVEDSKYDVTYNLPKDVVYTIIGIEGGKYLTLKSFDNRHIPAGHLADRFILAEEVDLTISPVIRKIRQMETRKKAPCQTS